MNYRTAETNHWEFAHNNEHNNIQLQDKARIWAEKAPNTALKILSMSWLQLLLQAVSLTKKAAK